MASDFSPGFFLTHCSAPKFRSATLKPSDRHLRDLREKSSPPSSTPAGPKMAAPGAPTLGPPSPPPEAPVSPPPRPRPPRGLQAPVPPPPPPPAAAVGTAPPRVFGLEKSRLLQEALAKAGPVPTGREDARRLLKLHKDRFRSDLQWMLFCADLPSLIQEGPQCGLVALWMAGTLLSPPSGVPLERLVQVAVERGYTAQGEMFSVADMGRLAEETLGCQAELLCGGLGGPNRGLVLQHLVAGHPMLIPYPSAQGGAGQGRQRVGPEPCHGFGLNTSTSYDEDFNHEPCRRKGHKAHWAVSSGQELALPAVGLRPDPG
ncbi:actin maturation protease isoform X3 [Lepus europaeus]|uniref:actin maturation protease isoform X3 n=1 Tax=Lepus europaeus TaxID=9983 RepID=UPI002B4A1F10|nr:actin maturation protease isoform X3 [Lepus europaeus]